jgi:hypothetical protein
MTDDALDGTGHLDVETLSAHLDGELAGAVERAAELHLRSCAGCQESLSRLQAMRDAVAAPVAPLSEPARSEMVARAVMTARDDVDGGVRASASSDPLSTPRRDRRRVKMLSQAAAIVGALAIAGGAVVAVRSLSSTHQSGTAAGAQDGGPPAAMSTTTAIGAGQGQGSAHESTGNTGAAHSPSHPSGEGAVAVAGRPIAGAVVLLRPVAGLTSTSCGRNGSPTPEGGLLVPLPLVSSSAGARCLRLGRVIVAAWPPTGVSVGGGTGGGERSAYLTIALTQGAAQALLANGVVISGSSANLLHRPPVVPDVPAWRVVALEGRSVLGDVSELVTTRSTAAEGFGAIVADVSPESAARVRSVLSK